MNCDKHEKPVKKTLLLTGYVCDVCDGISDIYGNPIKKDTAPPPALYADAIKDIRGFTAPSGPATPTRSPLAISAPVLCYKNMKRGEIDSLYNQLLNYKNTAASVPSQYYVSFNATDKEAEILLDWGGRHDLWQDWMSGNRTDPSFIFTGQEGKDIVENFLEEYLDRLNEDTINGYS